MYTTVFGAYSVYLFLRTGRWRVACPVNIFWMAPAVFYKLKMSQTRLSKGDLVGTVLGLYLWLNTVPIYTVQTGGKGMTRY